MSGSSFQIFNILFVRGSSSKGDKDWEVRKIMARAYKKSVHDFSLGTPLVFCKSFGNFLVHPIVINNSVVDYSEKNIDVVFMMTDKEDEEGLPEGVPVIKIQKLTVDAEFICEVLRVVKERELYKNWTRLKRNTMW